MMMMMMMMMMMIWCIFRIQKCVGETVDGVGKYYYTYHTAYGIPLVAAQQACSASRRHLIEVRTNDQAAVIRRSPSHASTYSSSVPNFIVYNYYLIPSLWLDAFD
jgi:hypothetical protein